MKYLERNFLFRYYSKKAEVEQVLILCSMFSMFLLGCRVVYTGSILFLFLAWNLFLAFIPYAISRWMTGRRYKNKWGFLLSAFVWLIFVPNAFYILTDLFHLDMNEDVPLWYDLALLLSFAWTGLLFGILSVRQMEKLFESYFSKHLDLLFIAPVMLLNGFGIYIGRYLRFNSWDVVTSPFQLIQDTVYLFIHPLRSRFDWSMIICYSILLGLIYITIKRLSKVL